MFSAWRFAALILAAAAVLAGSACTEEVSTVIRVELRFPEDRDPLADVVELRIAVHGEAGEEQVHVLDRPSDGEWSGLGASVALGRVDLDPGRIVVEGMDGGGRIVCAGESLPIPIRSGTGGRVAVFVQTLGTSGLAPSMPRGWRDHSAAYLSGGGVMLAGGPDEAPSGESWVYALDLYEPIAMASLPSNDERSLVGLAPLGGGRALLWGGSHDGGQVYSLDPAENVWEEVEVIDELRRAWPAPLWGSLPDGGVVTLRGRTLVELTSGSTPTAVVVGEVESDVEPETFTVLSSRLAAITGSGGDFFVVLVDLGDAEIRPVPQPARSRAGHAVAALSDGRAVIAGGADESGMNEDVDVLDAVQESWSALEGLLAGHGRMGATLSRLPDDRLVLAGGVDAGGEALADAVVIDVDAATATVIELVSPRVGHTATALPMGTVLLIGGETDDGEGLATVEVLRPPP